MALADCVERTYVRRYVSKQQFFFKEQTIFIFSIILSAAVAGAAALKLKFGPEKFISPEKREKSKT